MGLSDEVGTKVRTYAWETFLKRTLFDVNGEEATFQCYYCNSFREKLAVRQMTLKWMAEKILS